MRGVIADRNTPVSVIMEARFDLSGADRAEIAEVGTMSNNEIAREASKVRHLVPHTVAR